MNASTPPSTPKLAPDPRAVRVLSKGMVTAGFLLQDRVLDADGTTVSVVGCKSGIPGRQEGDTIFVVLTGGHLVPALVTHIHAVHDRFRAAVTVSRLADDSRTAVVSLDPPKSAVAADVNINDPT